MSLILIRFIVIITLLFPICGFTLNLLPGTQYIYYGYGAKELALGLTGISELGSIDGNSFNPASLGDERRVANSFTIGGFGSQNLLSSAGIAYPTDIGVFSINGLYTGNANTNFLNSLYGAQVNIAKPITENLFWGFGINLGSGTMASYSDWQAGIDMGIISSGKSDKTGIGFYDPSYGLVLKNIGKTINLTPYDPFPAMGIGAGASFYPIKFDFYKLKIIGDLFFPFNPFNVVLNAGIENTFFDLFKLRFGYIISTPSLGIPNIGPLNFGAGLSGKIKLKDSTDIDLSYALQNQSFNGKQELAHFVTVNVAWGYYDDQKPTAIITPNTVYFSPNFDAILDEVKFSLDIKDNEMVDSWEVNIIDSDKKIVKTFKSLEKLQLRSLTFQKFIGQILSRKQQVEIPKEVVWNGQNENGLRMPDGEYTYILKAWDENRNTVETEPGKIILDTIVPKIETTPSYLIFSPNNDGVKDDITFNLKSSDIEDIDKTKAVIQDTKSNIIKSYEFEGKLPDKIVWDGRNNNGTSAAEGEYSFHIIISNLAGSKAENTITGIRLVTNYQTVSVEAGNDAFSPNGDGVKDNITFKTKISNSWGLEKWSLKIYDANNSVVKEFKGEKNLPDSIIWDGKSVENKTLADGIYSYDLQLNFDSGNFPKSARNNVRIDTTPPYLSVKPQYNSFSPNADGKQDTIDFYNIVKGDGNDIIEVKISDSSGNVVYYNQYEKKDFPSTITWNGLDKDLKPLPEGKYNYELDGTDFVGNKSSAVVKDILLKTGLEKVAVQSDVPAISPNNENAVHKAFFSPSVTSKEGIISFTLDIVRDKKVIRSFNSDNFIDKIEWDGSDDSGKTVKDGIYTYLLKVKYNFGDEPVSTAKTIKVDTVAPYIDIKPDYLIFSPNNDGRKDTLTIKQAVKGDNNDKYQAVIIGPEGKSEKTYNWVGTVPAEIVWDGNNDNGNPVNEGIYTYQITGIDFAKNKTLKTINGIKLVRKFETLDFSTDVKAFAPNGSGSPNTIKFLSSLSSTEDLLQSELTIQDSKGEIIKKFVTDNELNKTITWDGKDEKGIFADDGLYTAEMRCNFNSGNLIVSSVSNIVLDKTPPAYKFNVSPELFTPDGDGENDILFINLELNDFSDVKQWELNIYKKLDDVAKDSLFKRFSGTGNIKQIFEWDGLSDDKQDHVESVQDYILELKAEDTLGNKLPNVNKVISAGVLVEKTTEGLKIRVSNIHFAFDKADLIGDSKKTLDKVIYIIRKILSDPEKYGITENYKIEISGHTDDIGTEEYNQKLSEKRALAVYKYLIENDIDPKILTSAGYGKSKPYKIITQDMSKEKKDDYRARNRRVEFFIRK